MKNLTTISYNIHKGLSLDSRRYTLHKIRDELRLQSPDLIFLQEIRGHLPSVHKNRGSEEGSSQYEYLAHEIWPHHAYGKNAVYGSHHHGNAILSRHAISSSQNIDISTNEFEKRGLLLVTLPWRHQTLYAACTHLNLLESGRKLQLAMIVEALNKLVPRGAPLILAGDFNDWRQNAHELLDKKLRLHEAFLQTLGKCAKTFPSFLPTLSLDRIYFRQFECSRAERLPVKTWSALSDHLPLLAEFRKLGK